MGHAFAWDRRDSLSSPPGSLDFLIREPAEVYHAKAKNNVSSHQLAEFRESPLLYRKRQLGLITNVDRPAFQIGRAAHTLILEGRDAYERQYAIGGPVNSSTGQVFGPKTKAYQEWAERTRKPVLTDAQATLIEQLYASVSSHPVASELLSDGVPEGVVRCDYRGLACQARFDWLNPTQGLVDLKTCDHLRWLQADAKTFGYIHQLAFYRSILALQTGELVSVHLVAVEKREPFRCGIWLIDPDVLAIAEQENEAALERLLHCRQTDAWPTGYEEVRVIDSI